MSDRPGNVEPLFLAALEKQTAAERDAFLDQACGTDHGLRRRVEALLKAHDDAGSFLEKPLIEKAAPDRLKPPPEGAIGGGDHGPRQVAMPRGEMLDVGTLLLEEFEVEKHLGRGGMGDVYLVRSRFTGEHFAAKRILPELTRHQRYRRMFFAELRTWIDLPEHPNLAACRFFRKNGVTS